MINQHKTNREIIKQFNRSFPLVEHLLSFIAGKRDVKILDVGSGPFTRIGRYLEGVAIELHCADTNDFKDFYKRYGTVPLFPIEYQNMEKLTYPDNYFDLVHCQNALDHTKDARKAVEEMIRVCKPEGWIYIDCHLDQKDTGHKHYWNAKQDGSFTNGTQSFNLNDYGFFVNYIVNGDQSKNNQIIATLQK